MACSPAEPVLGCVPDTFLGVCPRCHRFVLRLQNLFSPIPRPALAERSSHAGEGGNLKFIFARGFALASPHCAGRDTVYRVGFRCRRSACPRRCLLDLPRGRGPSQTPKFPSPGPPSPWLPLPGRKQKPFCSGRGAVSGTPEGNENPCRSRREFGDMATARKVKAARVQSRGCKGRNPLHPHACAGRFAG